MTGETNKPNRILFISGLVIADEMTNANVLIMDVFTALFRVSIQVDNLKPQRLTLFKTQLNKMTELEEMHIRSLKVGFDSSQSPLHSYLVIGIIL